jgi:hypothetical protein
VISQNQVADAVLPKIDLVASSKLKPRRSAGTRTALGVLRHLFRPPTPVQKSADLEYVASGGELIVSALLVSARKRTGVHWLPRGHLHLNRTTATWRGKHKFPDLTFSEGDWIVRSNPPDTSARFALVSFVNEWDRGVHYELRIPTPDLQLLVGVVGQWRPSQ